MGNHKEKMGWNFPSILCSEIKETVLTASVFGPDLGALHVLRAEWDTGTDESGRLYCYFIEDDTVENEAQRD